MNFLAWLLVGSGGFLTWAAVTNHHPKDTLIAIVRGKSIPAAGWTPLPRYGEGIGTIIGEAANDAISDGSMGSATKIVGDKRQKVIAYAKAQLGERYVWGAAGPSTWDCSGLTMRAYEQVGIKLPHHAASQQLKGTKVSKANAKPGDLVFWGPVSPHVAIWLGNNKIIHAPKSGDVVRIASIYNERIVSYRSYLS